MYEDAGQLLNRLQLDHVDVLVLCKGKKKVL